jgi:hypothetical protein
VPPANACAFDSAVAESTQICRSGSIINSITPGTEVSHASTTPRSRPCKTLASGASTKAGTRTELAAVQADALLQAVHSANACRNLAIARLACCTRLRVSDIAALGMDDLVLGVSSALAAATGDDQGKVLVDGAAVVGWRHAGRPDSVEVRPAAQGATARDPFVCSVQAHLRGDLPQI